MTGNGKKNQVIDRFAPPGYVAVPFVGGPRGGTCGYYTVTEYVAPTLTSHYHDAATRESRTDVYRLVGDPLDGGYYEFVRGVIVHDR